MLGLSHTLRTCCLAFRCLLSVTKWGLLWDACRGGYFKSDSLTTGVEDASMRRTIGVQSARMRRTGVQGLSMRRTGVQGAGMRRTTGIQGTNKRRYSINFVDLGF